MKSITCISFDIWSTLIKSNPEFKPLRSAIIADALACNKEIVALATTSIDKEMDTVSDETGQDFTCTDRIKGIIKSIPSLHIEQFSDSFYVDLEKKINEAFVAYPPSLIEEDLPHTLKLLKEKGLKICLLSNTGFIKGEVMRGVLTKLGVMEYVDFSCFSNELGFAKPHHEMFQMVTKTSGYSANQCIHVGDNIKADYEGSQSFGMNPVLFDPKRANHEVRSVQKISELLNLV